MGHPDPESKPSRPYRPPVGVPKVRESPRLGVVVSVVVHVVVGVLLALPLATHVVTPILQGAGGAGPVGGGGGGRRGSGGAAAASPSEHLQYIQVTPEAPRAADPVVAPPRPEIVPPKRAEAPRPSPIPAADTAAAAAPQPTADVAAAPGAGGGTGSDGTTGSGPGSGGGVGTGIGTGRGSGVGPGTGGGTQVNYPPLPIEMFLPPMPIPDRVRGFRMIAEFDVDETGRVVSITFTETKDGGYNRRLREVLRSIRFRPGSRPDGTPVRMKAQIEYIL